MYDALNKVAFSGVGHSKIGRRLDRELGLLAIDASLAAIEDAGLRIADIDGIVTYPELPSTGHAPPADGFDVVTTAWMIRNLGLTTLNYWGESGAGNISTAIGSAIQAVASGACSYVLAFRALHLPRDGSYTQFRGEVATGSAAYSAPYGLSHWPLAFALNYMRYQKLYGAKREHLAAYALAARRGANKNPYAFFHDTPMTMDDYMSCRMVADPLCLYDCDIPVDGAAAVIITSAERARDLKVPPAYVTGLGQAAWSPFAPAQYDDLQNTAATLGKQIWESSGLRPSDVSGAMLYDGFTPDIYFWLEGFGFCGRGEAYEWIQNGRIEQDGELPINTFGGNVSEGRLHGMGHWVEATLQVQGRAAERQIPDARHVVVATGILGHGSGALLSSEPL
jgi:acetyl-CoA acetyltransferase